MSNHKVIWHEGMFLCAHHFQQQERYLEHYADSRFNALFAYGWGFSGLTLDADLLQQGKVAIKSASGIMPDGIPFNLSLNERLPAPLILDKEVKDAFVYCRLANYNPSTRHSTYDDDLIESARYIRSEEHIIDSNDGVTRSESIEVGDLNTHLSLSGDEEEGYVSLAIARVIEVKQDGLVVLDPLFIEPCMAVKQNERLAGYLSEIKGMLQQRSSALALRQSQTVKGGGTSSIADFMLLVVVNRYVAELTHLERIPITHPEALFVKFLGLLGELSAFFDIDRQLKVLPTYDHRNLKSSFIVLHRELSKLLSAVFEQNAIQLKIEERSHGVKVATIPDRRLIKEATFYLAVKADVPNKDIQSSFPGQLKLGAVENIAALVNNQLIGIGIEQVTTTPREIPVHNGYHYFRIDSKSEYWSSLKNSGGFALHVSGDYPGLMLEMWAVRS